jgi:serine-type D-Ala-D-Ala carboxypeptidase (penicillin-binding protein 5/6)
MARKKAPAILAEVEATQDSTQPSAPLSYIPLSEASHTLVEDLLHDDPTWVPKDQIPTIPQLCIAITLLSVVLGYPYLTKTLMPWATNAVTHTAPSTEQHAAPTLSKDTQPNPPPDPFQDVEIEAKAAYVWDVTSQRALYSKNPNAQLPLASLTKLMTALVVYESKGDELTSITLGAINQEGENGFHDGDTWHTDDLLAFTLMTSSNDGAYALAAAVGSSEEGRGDPEGAFVEQMNAKAREIGLTQTYFTNATGLDISDTQSGSYGSARDMAFLMEYLVRSAPHILEATTLATAEFSDEAGAHYTATNTHETVESIPGALGSKTGYTVLAGGNLVIAFNAGSNRPVVVSVLGSTKEGRFTDVRLLTEKAIALLETP